MEGVTHDMLRIREDLIARMTAAPPLVTVTEVVDEVDDKVFRHIEATLRVPLYVSSGEPGAVLRRDEAGEVIAEGAVEVPFILRIPQSLKDWTPAQPPARVLQFGHGFFDSMNEIERGWLMDLANRHRFVVVAADLWGMSVHDLAPLIDAIAEDPSGMLDFTDRLHQGMANFIAMTYALAGPMRELPVLQQGGALVYDPEQIYFYGCSQGAILGGTYVSLAPKIARGALSVGGASFTFMMSRSRKFIYLLMLMEARLSEPLGLQKWIALLPTVFDRIDPVTYAPRVLRDMYPDSPAERWILMHNGVGDTDVNDLAGQLLARTIGIQHLQPAPRPILGLEPVSSPYEGSAIVEIDFGIEAPLPGTWAEPPLADNEVHNGVRGLKTGMEQIDAFLHPDGHIASFCDGICDPE
jgi:hypothetical protein